MKFSAHEATITTARVEIKTLTIGGKQVTLAVFRQLPEEDWLDANGHPKGWAWGTVNYHPDSGCKLWWGHLHVVWQKGGELRRCLLPLPEDYGSHTFPVPDSMGAYQLHWRVAKDLPQLFIAV
jgi:hypothetical protein